MHTNITRHFAGAAVGLASVVLAVGCDGGPPRARVKGTITVDGQPLTNGSVEFFPVGAGQSAGTNLHSDGTYTVETSPGEMKVSVYGSKVVGKRKAYDTPTSPLVDVVENAVPARYNTKSELKAGLKEGANEVNFDLTSKPKK